MGSKLKRGRWTWLALGFGALLLPGTALSRGNPGRGGGGGRGGGPPDRTESVGNNLSNPAIFAEGYGILGASSSTADSTLPDYKQVWTGLRIPADGNPTLPADGVEGTYCLVAEDPCPPESLYYLQGIEQASWQASWIDGTGSGPFTANVKWGDNLFGSPWTTTSTIHLEVSMKSSDEIATGTSMVYFPTQSLYGSGINEVFGSTAVPTDAAGLSPGVYSESAYLLIQQLDENHDPIGTIHTLATWNRAVEGPSTSALTPEVNASGNVVFSYNWFTGRDNLAPGFYRLTFGILRSGGTLPGITAVAPAGNVDIVGVSVPGEEEGGTATIVPCGTANTPQSLGCDTAADTSSVDLELTTGTGGQGGGGGGGGGGHGGGGG